MMEQVDHQATTNNVKARGKWRRYILYALAAVGVLAIAAVALGLYLDRTTPQVFSIDESQTVETVMTRTYGKYSETHKGWLYVGDDRRTYVMRIVQQARAATGGIGDDLYFVASGAALDGKPGAVYGVFQIRTEGRDKEHTLVEISSPYRYESDVPPTPEMVRFEKLGPNVWGWIVRVQDGIDPKERFVQVNNVILAPHDNDIAQLANFPASLDFDPGIDCGEANRRHEAWLNPPAKPIQASAETPQRGELAENTPRQVATGEEDDESDEPLRCSKARWTYRLDSGNGNAFTPIYITGKGMKHGTALEEKTYKVMFDSKSFVYILPKELSLDD